MNKKLLVILASGLLLAGCGGASTPEPQTVSLDGTYVSEDQSDTYHEAEIEDGTITINWISDDGKTKALYWKGSAPEEVESDSEWTSEGDTEAMSKAMLASQDTTKDFEYKDGMLIYHASAMGVERTVELKKEK